MTSPAIIQAAHFPAILRSSLPPPPDFPGKGGAGRRRRNAGVSLPPSNWRENASLNAGPQEYRSILIDKRLGEVQSQKKIPELKEEGESSHKRQEGRVGTHELIIKEIKTMLRSLNDGEITSSAYDTAWVAMVPNLDGGGPHFPSCLRWIIDNQLDDGSWGYDSLFSAHDRIINTLACAVALRSWSVCPDQCERGLLFLRENIWRMAEENHEELMPIGFEVALPSLIDIAKGLGLDFPYKDPALKDIYEKREIKMKRIPREVMHKVPTSLLHSLEGMRGLEWEKLLQLQSLEGSFLFSPSSTAYALMETGDENCLRYLEKVVDRFHGGVPNVYPVDIFEHLWVVDRLERLGISHYFQAEIEDLMQYVFQYWSEKGLCWARNSKVHDIDDTAMGFRLLRLHGYNVTPEVFRNFERDGEFFGFMGQSNQSVTGIYNLNRASQLIFSGEDILDQAKSFSYNFLREKQASNQLLDKWVIAKDLPGEVAYALDFPFYASLPRIEARWYIQQYGAGDDIWIGKTLYRMLCVNHVAYLNLAKVEFNRCQAIHQLEWLGLQRWHEECGLEEYGVSIKSMIKPYFLAAASIFESDRSIERLTWARTAVLAEAISSFYRPYSTGDKITPIFSKESLVCPQNLWPGLNWTREGPVDRILGMLGLLNTTLAHKKLQTQAFRHHLRRAWVDWLLKLEEGESHERGSSVRGETSLLLIRTIELCAGRTEPECEVARLEYANLARLASSICSRLQVGMWISEGNMRRKCSDGDLESEIQELVKGVLEQPQRPNGLKRETKRTFMAVVKSFYYMAWCPSAVFDDHISKVLFEPVE